MTAIRAYDLFCGAGGWTTGAYQACEALGLELDMKCLNHWGPACNTIQSNHPVIPVNTARALLECLIAQTLHLLEEAA